MEKFQVAHSLKDTRSQKVSDLPGSGPERSDAAEEKRRAARRRFLLGGASALPVILTVTSSKPAHSQGMGAVKVGFSVCMSLEGDAVEPPPGELTVVCTMIK